MIVARGSTSGEGAARTAGAVVQAAFVLSCERSGSTLLRWLLDTHPDVASPGELRLGRLAFDLYVTLSRTVLVDRPNDDPRRVRDTLREVRRTLDGILGRYAQLRGKRVWCEKSPENVGYLDALANAYPDGRYVCLYRDPRDVVHSCLEASRDGFMAELAEYARREPDQPVQAMTRSWADKTHRILAFERRNPGLSRRLRYEDLVRSPEDHLQALFSFLGVPKVPGIAERAFRERHDAGGGDRRIRRTSRVEASRVGRGRDLPMDRIEPALRARVNSLARSLGYDEI